MTAPANNPLGIIRGDDEAILITVKDGDNNNASLIKNGCTFYLTVKRKINDRDDQALFADDYPVTADAESFTIDLSNTETVLSLGSYYADVQFKDQNGKIKTIYRGEFTVEYDITRRS